MDALAVAKRDILIIAHEDAIGLWHVIDIVHDAFPGASHHDIQEVTLRIIRNLLDQGLVQAGFPDGRRFDAWKQSSAETVTRIKAEWDAIGREPRLGEIVWFNTTEKGDREADKL
jgi:hypothetical protein